MTQNLSAPPTQNTAPVYEFRCLYTSDLRRKQKRWQDGFLRFHTFNKRIMVYEAPSRNYVGDKHWRDDEDLQDGDELQLEKPVLVQVGEQTGSTETDLTELLEKRNKRNDKPAGKLTGPPQASNGITPTVNGPSTSRQPLGQISQLRPKSLNALLGTPKGRIGRASLASKSPYELRHDTEAPGWGFERPAKRQCLELPPQAIPKTPAITPPIQTRVTLSPSTTTLNEPGPETEKGKTVQGGKQAKDPEVRATVEAEKRPRRIELPRPTPEAKERSPIQYGNASKSVDGNIPGRTDATASKAKPTFTPNEIMSDEEATYTDRLPRVKKKLQVASRKPRKKLIYKELLPQKKPVAGPTMTSEIISSRASRISCASIKPSKKVNDDLADFHEDQQILLADGLDSCNGHLSHPHHDRGNVTDDRAASPGLFVSQEDSNPLSAIPRVTKNASVEPHASACSHLSFDNICGERRRPPSQQSTAVTVPVATSTVHDTALTLSKMDEILFPRSQPSHHPELSGLSIKAMGAMTVPTSSPLSIPVTPPKTMIGPTPQKDSPPVMLVPSSPVYQPQSDNLPKQSVFSKTTPSKVPLPKPRPPSPQVAAQSTQPSQLPTVKGAFPVEEDSTAQSSDVAPSTKAIPTIEPHKLPLSRPPPSKAPASEEQPPPKLSSPNPPSPKPVSPLDRQIEPLSPTLHPTKAPPPNQPLLHSTPTPTPTPPTTNPFTPHLPPPSAPEFDLRIAQKPLPAFQAPRPKPRVLKKSTSDITTMRAPETSKTPVADNRPLKDVAVRNDGTTTPWGKEAWDLFGCGRDGVQCSYEEFKRKEGLL